jgi:hypothetical protein
MRARDVHAQSSLAGSQLSGQSKIYWHRDLPPLNAEPAGEHTVDAVSCRVSGRIEHRDELWEHCYQDLMKQAQLRLTQELERLGGTCAHVLSESVESRHDPATNEAWLHGRFTYTLFRNA